MATKLTLTLNDIKTKPIEKLAAKAADRKEIDTNECATIKEVFVQIADQHNDDLEKISVFLPLLSRTQMKELFEVLKRNTNITSNFLRALQCYGQNFTPVDYEYRMAGHLVFGIKNGFDVNKWKTLDTQTRARLNNPNEIVTVLNNKHTPEQIQIKDLDGWRMDLLVSKTGIRGIECQKKYLCTKNVKKKLPKATNGNIKTLARSDPEDHSLLEAVADKKRHEVHTNSWVIMSASGHAILVTEQEMKTMLNENYSVVLRPRPKSA